MTLQIRVKRYFHRAIITAIAKLFFGRAGYGRKKNSTGTCMYDVLPHAVVAWVCALVIHVVEEANCE